MDQQYAVRVAQAAQPRQPFAVERPGAAFALDRLDDHRRRRRAPHRFVDRGAVVDGELDIARQARAEAVEIGGIARGIDRGIGAAVKGSREPHDVDPLRSAVDRMISARGLERALDRLRSRIAEEHRVRERRSDQAGRQFLLPGNAEDVRDVPQLARLFLQRRHQARMGMAQAVGGDARHAIEKGSSVAGVEPHAVAAFHFERGAVVDAHQCFAHSVPSPVVPKSTRPIDTGAMMFWISPARRRTAPGTKRR